MVIPPLYVDAEFDAVSILRLRFTSVILLRIGSVGNPNHLCYLGFECSMLPRHGD